MPSERIDIDVSDVIEIRNFSKWVKRELTIFKNQSTLQNKVVENITKITSLPIEELARMRNNGY